MTAIVILNVVLIAAVVFAVVGGLGWSIVSERSAGGGGRRTRRASTRRSAIRLHTRAHA